MAKSLSPNASLLTIIKAGYQLYSPDGTSRLLQRGLSLLLEEQLNDDSWEVVGMYDVSNNGLWFALQRLTVPEKIKELSS
jgi:hypothetical protein